MILHYYYPAQGCGTWTWLKCAFVVGKCAASCYKINVPECIDCVGSSYSTCKDCFSRQELLQMQGKHIKIMFMASIL